MSLQKRILTVLAIVGLILLIPTIAMQFSDEVRWTLFDYAVATGVLLVFGFATEFMLRKVRTLQTRILVGLGLLLAFLLVWAELAVGIFNTSYAGS